MIARHLPILFMLAAAALLGCGGSSSETPWPVEPEGATPGPAGESTERDETELPSDVTDERETPEPDAKSSSDAGVMRKRP
jgi:hypothetical protein